MDLQSRKIIFVQEFLNLQNEEIIISLEEFMRLKKCEQVDKSMKPMSMKQFNLEIDQSMEDSRQGRLFKANDIKEKYSK